MGRAANKYGSFPKGLFTVFFGFYSVGLRYCLVCYTCSANYDFTTGSPFEVLEVFLICTKVCYSSGNVRFYDHVAVTATITIKGDDKGQGKYVYLVVVGAIRKRYVC